MVYRPGIDRPLRFAPVRPCGIAWVRTFGTEDAAWRAIVGAIYTNLRPLIGHVEQVANAAVSGWSVQVTAWEVKKL